ncbi:hypothetical protein MN608_09408 [Microdochium nivale]|nr:hypothetical protein MN608_09408 [Microdochium nivale]
MSGLPDFVLIEAPLAGLAMLPFLGIGIASLVLFWKCNDPARRGFKWLGTASLGLGIYAVLDLAMTLHFRYADPSNGTIIWLPVVTMLFRNVAYIQLFAVLVGVAVGVHRVAAATSENHNPSRFRKIVRWSTYAAVGLLYIMAFLEFVLRAVYTPSTSLQTPMTRKLFVPMGVTVHMLLLAAYFVALGLAVYVFGVARKAQMAGNVHKLLLAAAVLAWARAMTNLGYDILALAPRPDWGPGMTSWQASLAAIRKQFAVVVSALVGDFVLSLVAVILLFVAGRRKTGGLWSDSEARARVASKSEREHSPGI